MEQRPEEGTAEELLAQIALDDNVDGHRVKQKIITEISDNEKVFEIPENWTWVKLGKVCIIARGGSPRPIKEYITTADDAKLQTSPVSPSAPKNIVIGGLVGAILSIGIIFIRFMLDNRLHTKEDVEKYLEIPNLGVIPYFED